MAAPADSVVVAFEGPWSLSGAAQSLKTVEGQEPPLRPAARKIYAKNQAERKQGRNSFDPVARCLPAGIPRLYTQPGAFRMAIGDRFAGMFFETQHNFRMITMYKGHFEAIAPGYLGQAVGHWEGSTLVVDTDQFNDITLLDDAGLPHSDELHLVERMTVPADGKLHIAVTVTDPKTFTKPFTSEFVFEKQPGKLLKEDYCLERQGLIAKN
ncbi:MAG: hypothetical protein QM718_04975 [Steroidobacteraceae bacterium]